MISGTTPRWNKDASDLLAQFLSSGVGQVFLANLMALRPSLLSGPSSVDLNANALIGREVAGYERCLANILSLAEPPQEAVSEPQNYPPLDDDSQWDNQEKKT